MNRKTLCIILYLGILILLPALANAQKLGVIKNKFVYVGIPEDDFNAKVLFGKQRNSMWCWAACIQMVLNYYQIPITQEEIVIDVVGSRKNYAATTKEIFDAIDGKTHELRGKQVILKSNVIQPTFKELNDFLKHNKPLIVGIKQGGKIGHAMVLIGMDYDTEMGKPYRVTLAEPAPGNRMLRYMLWDDFKNSLIVIYKIWLEPIPMNPMHKSSYLPKIK